MKKRQPKKLILHKETILSMAKIMGGEVNDTDEVICPETEWTCYRLHCT